MKTWQYIDRRKQKRMLKVIEAYLRHKGLIADQFVFSYSLFKNPSYRVAGFKIATEPGEWFGKSRIYFSLIV